MKFDYGKGDVEIEVTFYTLYLYESEFGGDLIADLFGKVVISEEDDGVVSLDYTKTNWTASTKALWACMKAANESIPPYKVWSKEVGDGVNMFTVAYTLPRVIEQELFRLGVATVSEENEG